MADISPVRTPNKSIIRLLEPGSITPSAIEELSSQIDSLIQRGRKLRELKNSMSRSPPKKSFQDTQAYSLDLSGAQVKDSSDGGALDDILAMINASDPMFIEEARIPPTATYERQVVVGTLKAPIQELPTNVEDTAGTPCTFGISERLILDTKLNLRLRTKTQVSNERVTGETDSDVAVEAWKGSDLVGIGRKPSSIIPHLNATVPVDIWDVWQGNLLGKVLLSVDGVSTSPALILEPSLETARSSIQQVDSYRTIQPLEEYLVKRNLPKPPPPRVSTEKFVSFLSQSPYRKSEDLDLELSADEGESCYSQSAASSRYTDQQSLSRTLEEETLANIQSELSTADDLKSVLQQKILELDFITNKLTGTVPSPPAEVKETKVLNEPVVIDFPAHPVVTDKRKKIKQSVATITRRRRRRVWASLVGSLQQTDNSEMMERMNQTDTPPQREMSVQNVDRITVSEEPGHVAELILESSSVSVLPPFTEAESRLGLSMIQTSLVSFLPRPPPRPVVAEQVVRLSSKRKESIEKARKTISSLRKSFLRDADKMCSALSRSNSDDDDR